MSCFYWIRVHYIVLLNLCHDLVLVLENLEWCAVYLKIGVVLILWNKMEMEIGSSLSNEVDSNAVYFLSIFLFL